MMWGYYGNCYAGSGQLIGLLINILIAVIVIMIIVRVIRGHRTWKWPGSGAEEMLKERFAKGEISKEEYEERLRVLRTVGKE